MSSNMTAVNIIVSTNGLIHPSVSRFFLTFNLLICSQVIGCFGIVGNVINILNFTRQGLHDSVNVTLTSLSVSDLGALFCQMIINVFWGYPDMPFSTTASVLFFYPHSYFTRVSGYITAFAAFERCLCVVLPLKVKTIITWKVAIVVNCSLFTVLTMYLFPIYYVTYIDLKYNPQTNRSAMALYRRDNAESVFKVSYIVTDLVVPYTSFLVLILCTAFLITTLKSKARWRQSVTAASISQSSSKAGAIAGKEKKTTVMLATVSVIFIACLTPGCAMLTALGVVRELKAEGPYFDVTMLVLSFSYILETINCSVNTLVYYNMSSKYRVTLRTWFPHLGKEKN